MYTGMYTCIQMSLRAATFSTSQPFTWFLLQFLKYVQLVESCVADMQRSEDSLRESVPSLTIWVPGTDSGHSTWGQAPVPAGLSQTVVFFQKQHLVGLLRLASDFILLPQTLKYWNYGHYCSWVWVIILILKLKTPQYVYWLIFYCRDKTPRPKQLLEKFILASVSRGSVHDSGWQGSR